MTSKTGGEAQLRTVAVMGAGVAGLAAAARLHADGFDVSVYERRSRGARSGHGFVLLTGSRDPLLSISAGPGVESAGAELTEYELRSSDGQLLSTSVLHGARGYRREDFLDLLEARLPDDAVRYEAELEGFEVWYDGSFHAALFEDGSRVVADMFVGAEGSGAVTRPLVGTVTDFTTVRVRELACSAYSPDVAESLGTRFLRFQDLDGGRAVSAVPTGGGWVAWFVQFDAELYRNLPVRTPEERAILSHALLEGWPEPIGQLLFDTDYGYSHVWNVAEMAPLDRMYRNNLALVGEPAHAFLPFTSEGVSTAMDDAAALGDALWRVQVGKGLTTCLEAYSQARLNHTKARLREGQMLLDEFLNPSHDRPAPLVW